jgi:hypothetical protein
MNRGYKTYIKEGSEVAWKTFYPGFKNYIKFMVFSFIGSITSTFVLLQPFYTFANIKLIRNIKKDNEVKLIDSLDGIEEPKRFWVATIYNLIMVLFSSMFALPLIFSLMVLLSSLTNVNNGYIEGYPYQIEGYPYQNDIVTPANLVAVVIGLVIFSAAVIVIGIFMFPSRYILEKSENPSVAKTIKNSLKTSKGGKKTFIALVSTYLGFIAALYLLLLLIILVFLGSGVQLLAVLGLMFIFLISLAVIAFQPWFVVSLEVAIMSLYEDLEVEEIENKENNQVAITDDNYMDVLESFFSE